MTIMPMLHAHVLITCMCGSLKHVPVPLHTSHVPVSRRSMLVASETHDGSAHLPCTAVHTVCVMLPQHVYAMLLCHTYHTR